MRKSLAIVALAVLGSGLLAAFQELEVETGRRVQVAPAFRHQGRIYYRVRDLARIFGLRAREDGARLHVQGPKGEVTLREGRRIAEVQRGPDVQLSSPPWRRRGEWHVGRDFVDRLLGTLVEGRLSRLSATRYRLSGLQDVPMEVRLENYPPDRVRIVFESEREVPLRIREEGRRLILDFENYRPIPRMPDKGPDTDIVASFAFDPQGRGSFQIMQGPEYERYETMELRAPFRHVLDIYGAVEGRRVKAGGILVVIDAGHGGSDPGAGSPPDAGDTRAPPSRLIEKDLALEIAQRVGRGLSAISVPTMLTRSGDVQLDLEQRSSIGNYYRPRAFVSLHLGAAPWPEAGGPVVYVHAPPDSRPLRAGDIRAEEAAEDGDPAQDPRRDQGKKDPPSQDPRPRRAGPASEPLERWSEAQKSQRQRSLRLARALQERLNDLFQARNRVAEAPLALLAPVAVPAVLVELGHLTHPGDARRLRDEEFKSLLVEALVDALEGIAR